MTPQTQHWRVINGWLLTSFLVVIAACELPTEADLMPAMIEITAPLEIVQFEGAEIGATVFNEAGDSLPNVPVAWSSMDEEVATVTPEGSVTALAPGEVILRAVAGAVHAHHMLRITAAEIASFEVSAWEPEIMAGDSLQIKIMARDRHGNDLPDAGVRIEIEEGTIAEADGLTIRGLSLGQTAVRVEGGRHAEDFTLRVNIPKALVEILSINGQDPAGGVIEVSDTIVASIRVSNPFNSDLVRQVRLDFQADALWASTDANQGPGKVQDYTVRYDGRTYGDMQVRALAGKQSGPVYSEPAHLRGDAFLRMRIVEINGTPAGSSGPTQVADRFDVVVEVDVPDGAAEDVRRIWLAARFENGERITLGASQDGEYHFEPGIHRLPMTAHTAPSGSYRIYPIAVLWPERIWMEEVAVSVTNADQTPPEVVLLSHPDSTVVSTDNPRIIFDLTDSESGLYGRWIRYGWSGGCRAGVMGLSNAHRSPVRQVRHSVTPSECFGTRLSEGVNEIEITAIDNAFNEHTLQFVLIYDAESARSTEQVVVSGTVDAMQVGSDVPSQVLDRDEGEIVVEDAVGTRTRSERVREPARTTRGYQ